MFKFIPNTLTLTNVFLACLAIANIFNDNFFFASVLIFIAAVIDFLDGFVARLLKATSEIGAQLDSLSDMVIFGVVPGLLMYKLIMVSDTDFISNNYFFPYLGFLLAIGAALRLARFNVQNSGGGFTGLPTPASAIFVASIPIILTSEISWMQDIFFNTQVLIVTSFLLSFLNISHIKMFDLKVKSLNWKENRLPYFLIIASLILIGFFKLSAIPIIILLYLILSIINNLIKS